MAVLSVTLPGMPLIYSGQESRLTKRLAFFEKDAIDWKNFELQAFYTELHALKRNNPALANGQYGAPVELLFTGNHKVFAFRRSLGANVVTVAVNLTNAEQTYKLPGGSSLQLAPWKWQIDARL